MHSGAKNACGGGYSGMSKWPTLLPRTFSDVARGIYCPTPAMVRDGGGRISELPDGSGRNGRVNLYREPLFTRNNKRHPGKIARLARATIIPVMRGPIRTPRHRAGSEDS